jgi:hypothetical protein
MDNKILWIGGAVLAWFLFKPKSQNEALIQQWIEVMKANAEWYAAEVQKAADWNMSIEDVLRKDAIWMIEQGWQL